VKPGGHVIVSTFGPEGPVKCSGLEVVRYDAESLHREFGVHFHLLGSSKELHRTPFRTVQQFLCCYCRVESTGPCLVCPLSRFPEPDLRTRSLVVDSGRRSSIGDSSQL
jgi:hypothetical protein